MSNYTEIFDTMIFVLSQFVRNEKALNTKEIQELIGMSRRSSQRIVKSLTESGWLEIKAVGRDRLYYATEKSKQLFGAKS